MSIELKIKAKTLATEASYIRKEEQKMKRQARWLRDHQQTDDAESAYAKFWNLKEHRIKDLRHEARATHLARAFLRGFKYSTVEEYRLPQYEIIFRTKIVPSILRMVQKYSMNKNIDRSAIDAWIEGTI